MTSFRAVHRRTVAGAGVAISNHVTLVTVVLLLVLPPTWSLPVRQKRAIGVNRKSVDQPEMEFNDESFAQIGRISHGDGSRAGEKLYFQMDVDGESKTVIKAAIGSTAVLECEAAGSPNPTVHWVRHGHRILQGSRTGSIENVLDDEATFEGQEGQASLRVSSTRSRLFIDCVQPTDAGVYECVAETPTRRISTTFVLQVGRHGHNRRHDTTATGPDSLKQSHIKHSVAGEKHAAGCQSQGSMAGHEVAEPARVYMWTIHRLELDGSNVQLYCRAAGNPAPSITWYDRDERQISADDPHYKLLANGDLLINAVSWTDMGLYRCVANNQAGTDTATTFFYPTTE